MPPSASDQNNPPITQTPLNSTTPFADTNNPFKLIRRSLYYLNPQLFQKVIFGTVMLMIFFVAMLIVGSVIMQVINSASGSSLSTFGGVTNGYDNTAFFIFSLIMGGFLAGILLVVRYKYLQILVPKIFLYELEGYQYSESEQRAPLLSSLKTVLLFIALGATYYWGLLALLIRWNIYPGPLGKAIDVVAIGTLVIILLLSQLHFLYHSEAPEFVSIFKNAVPKLLSWGLLMGSIYFGANYVFNLVELGWINGIINLAWLISVVSLVDIGIVRIYLAAKSKRL